MPNIKSAVKRVKVTKVKTLKNNMLKSRLRGTIKKCETALNTNTDVEANIKDVTKSIDKAVAKGILHKNTAARRKSRLAKLANAANQ